MDEKKIGISELVAKIGDGNIQFQNLDTAFIRMDHDHKKGGKITFGTSESITPNGTEKLGIILWLPRDKVKEILAV